MVEYTGAKFCFLADGSVEETVINDKDILLTVSCEIPDIVVYDISSKQRRKSMSVRYCIYMLLPTKMLPSL